MAGLSVTGRRNNVGYRTCTAVPISSMCFKRESIFAIFLEGAVADVAATANRPPADDPKVLFFAVWHIDRDRHRTIALISAFEVVPGFFALDHMRVGINGQHCSNPPRLNVRYITRESSSPSS